MTDREYAICIYCQIFNVGSDGGDAHVRGILEAVSMLSEREQTALEYYFRRGMTYKETGQALGGIGNRRASQIVNVAIRRMRTRYHRNMSVAAMIKDKDSLLADANATIDRLYRQIDDMRDDKPLDPKIQAALYVHKVKVSEPKFSTRAKDRMRMAGINSIEDLLALNSFDIIKKEGGFGEKTQRDVITKMRRAGYTEWADRMEG